MATILIIEDEEDLRLLLRLTLSGEGHQILEAATGAAGAALWSDADLVLLDIRLPDINGLDLLRGLPVSATPVIAMSAHAGRDIRAAAIEAGCVEYLTKPFTPTELSGAIRTHLDTAA
jgi:two-component system, OmpR family, KDP operon response regulator KdpE